VPDQTELRRAEAAFLFKPDAIDVRQCLLHSSSKTVYGTRLMLVVT
jgi:hypothetical protein